MIPKEHGSLLSKSLSKICDGPEVNYSHLARVSNYSFLNLEIQMSIILELLLALCVSICLLTEEKFCINKTIQNIFI